ncbi:hypothetical protein GT045_35375 [Streptomyces sp. SID486]|nr:hypothetical protein [Streptomyces sp. SID486]
MAADVWRAETPRPPEPRLDHPRGLPPREREPAARSGTVRADQHHDPRPVGHRRHRLLPSHGDIEQACRRTVAALTALPADYRTGLVRRRALNLHEALHYPSR